jgi:hypothetical protein
MRELLHDKLNVWPFVALLNEMESTVKEAEQCADGRDFPLLRSIGWASG